jgi:DNA polymerase-3 subunit gamma/tau
MWDTKYRPLRFSDVLGQEGAVQVLKARLARGTAHDTSYIFAGGHGQGKTTLARILGRALLCQNLTADQEPCNECGNCIDTMTESSEALAETDAASRGTIEHIRTIVNNLPFVIQGAKKRVYIFDEVHRMSRDAQDVLLKPLEDKKLIGIFCTTEVDKIRNPIRSRCEEYLIRKITDEHVLGRMKMILQKEGVEFEDDAVLTVIAHCKGHVRDVLNKLEMFGQLGPITVSAVREGLNLSIVSTYYRILLNLDNPATAVRLAEEACERVGPSGVAEGIAEAAMNTYRLANKMGVDFAEIDRDQAIKVHALYGDTVAKFAEYFTRSSRVSRISLFSDIIACRAGAPASNAASVAAPVVIQVASAPAPVAAPTVASEAAPQPAPAPVVAAAPAGPKPSTPPPAPQPTDRRSDGIGNLKSSDTAALTSIDTLGVPLEMPRMGVKTLKPAPGTPANKRDSLLTCEEWKTKFNIRVDLLLPKESRG